MAADAETATLRRFSLADALSGSLRQLTAMGQRQSKYAKRSRLVQKCGTSNVYGWNVPKRDRQFLRDIFTTLIDSRWRCLLLVFVVTFLSTWVAFAFAYLAIAYWNGDMEPGRLPAAAAVPPAVDKRTADRWRLYAASIFRRVVERVMERNASSPMTAGGDSGVDKDGVLAGDDGWKPCFVYVDSFRAAFLFSLETQHTIGYGTRYVTTACPHAIVVLCIQCCCGILLQSFMVGVLFAKMARPKKRAQTLIFSDSAVVSLRDGAICMQMRVGDMRDTHLVEAHVRMQLIRQRVTAEGEVEPLYQCEMNVGEQGHNDDRLYLVWPVTVCHVIDSASPLYDLSSHSLPTEQFEVIVLLEGIVESTGMTVQARSSYLPAEIKWGHRFEKLVTYQSDNGSYRIDYSIFDSTYAVKTPTCSARELDLRRTSGRPLRASQYFFKREHEAQFEEPGAFGELAPVSLSRRSSFRPRTPSVPAPKSLSKGSHGTGHGMAMVCRRYSQHRSSDTSSASFGLGAGDVILPAVTYTDQAARTPGSCAGASFAAAAAAAMNASTVVPVAAQAVSHCVANHTVSPSGSAGGASVLSANYDYDPYSLGPPPPLIVVDSPTCSAPVSPRPSIVSERSDMSIACAAGSPSGDSAGAGGTFRSRVLPNLTLVLQNRRDESFGDRSLLDDVAEEEASPPNDDG